MLENNKFRVTIDEEEGKFELECPECGDISFVNAYYPVTMKILKCETCGFINEEDERSL